MPAHIYPRDVQEIHDIIEQIHSIIFEDGLYHAVVEEPRIDDIEAGIERLRVLTSPAYAECAYGGDADGTCEQGYTVEAYREVGTDEECGGVRGERFASLTDALAYAADAATWEGADTVYLTCGEEHCATFTERAEAVRAHEKPYLVSHPTF